MFYVGLDIHAKHIAMCVLTEVGKIYRRCQVRTVAQDQAHCSGQASIVECKDR
jgi:hypothetical protein